MKRHLISSILSVAVLSACFNSALACDAFRIIAKDGTVLIGRSNEFVGDLKSQLRTSPRGRTFTTVAPNGKQGLSWKAKYGYLFLNGLNVDITVDGMNEQGLSVEVLLFPGVAKYQTVSADQDSKALPYFNFGDWILSNFKTVDEVRQALPSIFVVNQTIPGMENLFFPWHFSVYDASGKGIVVEYIDGQLNIHDNPLGVMTNAPAYPWHMTNLNNYTQLKPTNPNPVVIDGVTFTAAGQGAGMVGLPGDISPPSRFVKTAVLLSVVIQPEDAAGALNMAEHIINNFDIPNGLAREPENGNYSNETTQWVDFKDLTHKVFYYRTYTDLSLHAVYLDKLDFSEKADRLVMPIEGPATINNITDVFLTKKMGA